MCVVGSQQKGFTLAETLIAVAILGIIGVLSFGTFGSAMKSRAHAEVVTERYHQVRQAMQRMAREIPAAFISDHQNCEEPASRTVFKGKGAAVGMRLDFTSFSHLKTEADVNQSDQNEISYYVGEHPDDNSRKVLFRRMQPRIDQEPEDGGLEEVLAEDISGIEFAFYDGQEKEWEDEWDSAGMDKKNQLPLFVSITMKALNPWGEEEVFTTKVRLFLVRPVYIVGRRCLD